MKEGMTNDFVFWYDNCATRWEEGLFLGNGYMGAVCFGSNLVDRFQLNNDSVWYGGKRNRINPDAKTYIPQIRQLLMEGRIKDAEILANETMAAIPEHQSHYEPLCDLFLLEEEVPLQIFGIKDGWNERMYQLEGCENYRRELNIETGIHMVSYEKQGKCITRSSFISYPDQVMVVASVGKTFRAFIERGYYVGEVRKVDENTIAMEGQCGPDGVHYVVMVRAIKGGLGIKGRMLHLDDDSVLCVASDTDYYHENPREVVLERLHNAEQLGYEKLRARHVEDFTELMTRCSLHINNDTSVMLSTEERLAKLEKGESDAGLVNLTFNYGRYLLASSSRQGSLPANLQGIWNDKFLPPWDSKFTININEQMNYWPAESCNLSDLTQPLFDLMKRMVPNGREVAREMYQARGWMAHHNTDLWADCAPQDTLPSSTYWQMGAAWLCLHLLEHYRYTLDKEFLAEYTPMIKEAILFFEDTLQENAAGEWIVSPSLSPENTYRLPNGETGTLCLGAMMDAEILLELLNSTLELCELTKEERDRYENMVRHIPKPKIEDNGTLQEWPEVYEEVEPGHRHVSHLFAVYPGTTINESTPELMQAAINTLNRRVEYGGGYAGWSRAWIINLWSRMGDGVQIGKTREDYLDMAILDNFLYKVPPYQIDGYFGTTAGIAEMLLQSHSGTIKVLPAIPESWKSGSVVGMRARGAITVDIEWTEKEIQASFTADADQTTKLQGYGELALEAGVKKVVTLSRGI